MVIGRVLVMQCWYCMHTDLYVPRRPCMDPINQEYKLIGDNTYQNNYSRRGCRKPTNWKIAYWSSTGGDRAWLILGGLKWDAMVVEECYSNWEQQCFRPFRKSALALAIVRAFCLGIVLQCNIDATINQAWSAADALHGPSVSNHWSCYHTTLAK